VVRAYWFPITVTALASVLICSGLLYVLHLNRKLRTSEASLRDLALHDALTRLPNRALFSEFAAKAIANATRHGSMLSILFLDLDDFKAVNDQHGHAAGDRLLQMVSGRIVDTIRTGDIAARVGGDEFIVLLDSIQSRSGIAQAIDRLIRSISAPYFLEGAELRVGCSVGASLFPTDEQDLDAMMRQADQALYAAKLAGKNCGCFFADLETTTEHA
jgi:diguanylate cyclase (GGDEF)-like protein